MFLSFFSLFYLLSFICNSLFFRVGKWCFYRWSGRIQSWNEAPTLSIYPIFRLRSVESLEEVSSCLMIMIGYRVISQLDPLAHWHWILQMNLKMGMRMRSLDRLTVEDHDTLKGKWIIYIFLRSFYFRSFLLG